MNQINTHQHQQSPSKTQREKDICFRCKNPGHWANQCPENNSPNRKSPIFRPSPTTSDPEFRSIHCPCGAGHCEIRVSGSRNNPNRKYYRCPGKFVGSVKLFCGFFKWCDKLREDEIHETQPQREYPVCGCGAGICSVRVEESGTNAGRSYFACPINKGEGACNFRQWVDNSAEQNNTYDEFDLSYEEVMQIDALERATSEPTLEEAQVQMEDNEEENNSTDEAGETSAGTPEVHPPPVVNSVSENNLDLDVTTPSNVTVQNGTVTAMVATVNDPLLQVDMLLKYVSANLLNMQPSPQRVTISALSCSLRGSLHQSSPLASPVGLEDQPWAKLLLNSSTLQNDDLDEGNSSIMTGTISQAFQKLAHRLQNDLLTLLTSMDPSNHETMTKEAGSTFAALDRLQVDYKLFKLRVTQYIKQAATLAHIEQTLRSDPNSQELVNRYNYSKSRFDEISRDCSEARDAFMSSSKRLSELRENASYFRDVLVEVETELSCCEAENAAYRERLVRVTQTMSECKASLEAASCEAAEALERYGKMEIELSAAKAAFEKARAQLRS